MNPTDGLVHIGTARELGTQSLHRLIRVHLRSSAFRSLWLP